MTAPVTSRADDRRRLFFAAGSAFVLVLAALLTTDGESVALAVGGWTVESPHVCLFRHLTGLDCAGCGLTRSFVAVAHGDWSRAWTFHRMGPLLFVLLAAQIPYHALALSTDSARWRVPDRIRRRLVTGLLALLLANWGLDLLLMI